MIGAPILDGIADRPKDGTEPDLSIADVNSARHIIIGPAGREDVLLRDSNSSLMLRLRGSRASSMPVTATFLIDGIPQPRRAAAVFAILSGLVRRPDHKVHRSRERLLLRDALVALDGRCVGASYRETAQVIFGADRVRESWSKGGAMKERIRRALAKGKHLRDGDYLELLDRGSRLK